MHYSIAKDASAKRVGAVTASLRFGNVWFETSDEERPVAARAARQGSVARERLHLVVQKGNLFRREHPEIPILLDQGRYLVADMSPNEAARCQQHAAQCFSIQPLPSSGTVFDHRTNAPQRAAQESVQAIVDRVSKPFFEEQLRKLVEFPTRLSTSQHFRHAAEQARSKLAELGFETRLEDIVVQGKASLNVIAERLGNGSAPRDVLLACAHLDSINQQGGPTAPAPGADDNASGSAGVLTIAHALQDHQPSHDLRLILWGGEEQGLFGSIQHIASLSQSERKRIRAVLNMDMIGVVNTQGHSVLIEGAALSQSVIDGLADAAALYTPLEVRTSLNPFNSDHVPFIDAGIPAVLTIEGDDSGNPHVHSAEDTLDRIDAGLALEILRMNVAYLTEQLE